ncbi:MAG: DUF3667 domain-containing protein, partial [Mucilaginibacter sp.]
NNNICKNCNRKVEQKFCSNCGQSTDTHPINFHYLAYDIQQTLLPVDRGFFYTVKELFTRPGHTIREFIEGKRINHFKPFALVLLLAGIYGFLYHYFNINDVPRMGGQPDIEQTMAKTNEWLANNYSLAMVMLIPFFAFGSYIVFRKSGYNYVQNVVINLFLTAQLLIVSIVLFPITYFCTGEYRGTGTMVAMIVGIALYMWSFTQLFPHKPKLKTGLKALWAYIFSYVIIFILATIGGVIGQLVFMK